MIQKSQCLAIDKMCKTKGKAGDEIKIDNTVRFVQ